MLFRLYDLDDDGFIVKEELFHVLRTSLLENFSINLTEKQMREIVDHTFKTLGCELDGKLSYGTIGPFLACFERFYSLNVFMNRICSCISGMNVTER